MASTETALLLRVDEGLNVAIEAAALYVTTQYMD
jgi:hypothetical protein